MVEGLGCAIQISPASSKNQIGFFQCIGWLDNWTPYLSLGYTHFAYNCLDDDSFAQKTFK